MSAITAPTTPPIDVERPLLVCGVGRSGTSLLQSMLNAHSQLAFPPETHFFRRHVLGQGAAVWRASSVDERRARLALDLDLARAGLDVDALARCAAPGQAFRALLAAVAAAEGKPRVGDKDPRNIDVLPALAREFPAAVLVHIVRDPRDVLASRMKAAWSAHRPWWVHPLIYAEQLRRGCAEGRRSFGERYLEVRYESLLAAPEAELRRVCERAELPFEPGMLDFAASARRLVAPGEHAWKKETLGPLLSGNTGKWSASLSPFQVAYCESASAIAFERFGYERADGSSALLDAATALLRHTLRAAYDLRTRRETTR